MAVVLAFCTSWFLLLCFQQAATRWGFVGAAVGFAAGAGWGIGSAIYGGYCSASYGNGEAWR